MDVVVVIVDSFSVVGQEEVGDSTNGGFAALVVLEAVAAAAADGKDDDDAWGALALVTSFDNTSGGARGAILCLVAIGSLNMFGFTTKLRSCLPSFDTRETSIIKLETSPKSETSVERVY